MEKALKIGDRVRLSDAELEPRRSLLFRAGSGKQSEIAVVYELCLDSGCFRHQR